MQILYKEPQNQAKPQVPDLSCQKKVRDATVDKVDFRYPWLI